MAKKKHPEYLMLRIQWPDLGDHRRVPIAKLRLSQTYIADLGRISVTVPIDNITVEGWILQQIIVPDPVRHPALVYGLFVKNA